MSHGLSDETIDRLARVLARFPEVESAVLFGSRAKGVQRPGSDIDLALRGDGLDWRLPGRIDNALDDLLLPYRFSLVLWNERTDPDVDAHIRRVGIPLYHRGDAPGNSVPLMKGSPVEPQPPKQADDSKSA